MCTPNIRRQKHLQNRLEKNNLFGNFHTCVEKPTHVKNKNTNKYIKTNTHKKANILSNIAKAIQRQRTKHPVHLLNMKQIDIFLKGHP